MSVVKINVLTVPPETRAALERRFAGRAGMVEAADGFEWFELLRPVEGTDAYLVYTRWRSEEDFGKWQASNAFQAGHAAAATDAAGEPPAVPAAGHPGSGHPGPAVTGSGGPAATGAQLWSFEVVQAAAPRSA
ncbi:antibiotic biosynthesis monooxygenase [Frankia sp. CiP3]|uniref:antibiotic biosynthesis monooxygenase family protein n=1 Tax=Frankia sp. CiP3 TaxID=2880971 RepID=UPI001EF7154D|nr:antibiotic biosynthesis monooxygenase [Frankia sp. CiP3]